MKKPTEEELIAKAKALGEATTKCSEEERSHIKRLYEDVQRFGDEQKAKGVYIDRSAFFAVGIILHPEIVNEGVRKAATDYVEFDHLFIKAHEDAQEGQPAASEGQEPQAESKPAPAEGESTAAAAEAPAAADAPAAAEAPAAGQAPAAG